MSDAFMWFIGVFLGALFVWMIWASIEDCGRDKRLMAQCMADRHKEYECVSMLRKPHSDTVLMPMPIVMPR